jgi:hypothetical protein
VGNSTKPTLGIARLVAVSCGIDDLPTPGLCSGTALNVLKRLKQSVQIYAVMEHKKQTGSLEKDQPIKSW